MQNRTSRSVAASCRLCYINDAPTSEIYTLSLHDALPISQDRPPPPPASIRFYDARRQAARPRTGPRSTRSEEHTSELQSRRDLVCRLLLEKKKTKAASSMQNRASHSLTGLRRLRRRKYEH